MSYLYGLNGMLNGLAAYGNTADVFVPYYRHKTNLAAAAKEFEEKLATNPFPFKVVFVELADIFKDSPTKPTAGWQLRFARWKYVERIKDSYSAFCLLDADMLVLDNVMNWFDLVENSSVAVIGHNALGVYNFHSDVQIHTNAAPYANIPCFASTKHWAVMKAVYENGMKIATGDMPAMYFAFRDAGLKVVELPDNLWIRNVRETDLLKRGGGIPPLVLSTAVRQRVSMIHGKYWSQLRMDKMVGLKEVATVAKPALRTNSDIYKSNYELCYSLSKYFNTECTIRLEWRTDI
jgi:hypothetical protein